MSASEAIVFFVSVQFVTYKRKEIANYERYMVVKPDLKNFLKLNRMKKIRVHKGARKPLFVQNFAWFFHGYF